MAESPEEAYDRVLAEEQGKGSSPAVAEARAKAARHRARKGLPTDPAGAAAAAGGRPAASDQPASASAPETPVTQAAAETTAPAPAAESTTPPAAAESAPAAAAGESAPAAAAASAPEPTPMPAATGAGPVRSAAPQASMAPASGGRGAAGRAARAGGSEMAPERIQRLLAVVKPEAIQRVERQPIDRVNVWPHLMISELIALLAVTAFLMIFSTFVDATFRELANINVTPNPSKAPWYFLGLQELLRYFHPQIAGVTIPQWIILGLMAAPYIDRNPSTKPADRKLAIVLFTIFLLFNAVLVILGSLFRGPGFNFIYPWTIPIHEIFEL
ncbi:MAG TPA: menaquinol-cytochrome c reductase cytochrome b subunit [Actinomycetota bacterium]|nr:menaquinol-cytochrome c reductase cytochrome b subunit [Actinomycetota bacterium]